MADQLATLRRWHSEFYSAKGSGTAEDMRRAEHAILTIIASAHPEEMPALWEWVPRELHIRIRFV
jgi:hypothetical protein